MHANIYLFDRHTRSFLGTFSSLLQLLTKISYLHLFEKSRQIARIAGPGPFHGGAADKTIILEG